MGLLARIQLAGAKAANRRGIYLGRRSTRIHKSIYRATRGRVGARMPGFPDAHIALLDHVGRKTGQHRTSPLMFVRDGDAIALLASKAGQPTDPAWFRNLMAAPDTSVQVGKTRHPVQARLASAAEQQRLWPKFVAMYPAFDFYAELAAPRKIPMVILQPRSA